MIKNQTSSIWGLARLLLPGRIWRESRRGGATIAAMLARKPWMLALCLIAGTCAGFVALAIAAANELVLPPITIALFSPGVRVAEFLVPGNHESLGWTFGWFLRVAIATNALFYFVLFIFLVYLAERLFKRPAKPY